MPLCHIPARLPPRRRAALSAKKFQSLAEVANASFLAQVKINGVRIELSEIEAALAAMPGEPTAAHPTQHAHLHPQLLILAQVEARGRAARRSLASTHFCTHVAPMRWRAGVSMAAVKAIKDPSDQYRLVGYVSPASCDAAEASAWCRERLLPSMVPARIIALPVLPQVRAAARASAALAAQ
jgi:hypothetical protein